MRQRYLRRFGEWAHHLRASRCIVSNRDFDRKHRAGAGVPEPLPDRVLYCDPAQQPLLSRSRSAPLVLCSFGGAQIAAHDEFPGGRIGPPIPDQEPPARLPLCDPVMFWKDEYRPGHLIGVEPAIPPPIDACPQLAVCSPQLKVSNHLGARDRCDSYRASYPLTRPRSWTVVMQPIDSSREGKPVPGGLHHDPEAEQLPGVVQQSARCGWDEQLTNDAPVSYRTELGDAL